MFITKFTINDNPNTVTEDAIFRGELIRLIQEWTIDRTDGKTVLYRLTLPDGDEMLLDRFHFVQLLKRRWGHYKKQKTFSADVFDHKTKTWVTLDVAPIEAILNDTDTKVQP